jgi:hypothetical protein
MILPANYVLGLLSQQGREVGADMAVGEALSRALLRWRVIRSGWLS